MAETSLIVCKGAGNRGFEFCTAAGPPDPYTFVYAYPGPIKANHVLFLLNFIDNG